MFYQKSTSFCERLLDENSGVSESADEMPKLPFFFFAPLRLCVRQIHIFNQQRQNSDRS
ncbi:hypothetical protein [Halotia branconii]|uniref:Uncharacterized protein n=1 Tax=Halotia branconii CENA392 TaxID=1539056 RepID=A0AAJ6NU64_9CYAN|nr:hypothetical protein [Halotia branconii]WGV26559.1 hypothetical protein QI031_03340 [Halotia branconii CENA392]